MASDEPVGATSLSFDGPGLEFGDGCSSDVSEVLAVYDIDTALVVTDEGIESAGILDAVRDPLSIETTTYYATTEPSTSDFDDLPEGPFDCILAIGGGSCLDTAKVAALLLTHGGAPADYLGVDAVPGPVVPIVAVPTTSGTGSQATQTAVVTHDGVKRGISDEYLRPDVAVVDPALTWNLPRSVTARSGFDAFVHALESLTARNYRWVAERPINYQGANPVSRPLSRRALTLVAGALERATFDGDDHDARRRMSLGSHLAGWAFSNAGLGAVHALASTVGGMTGRPHGECLAASIRTGLIYNLPVRRDAYAAIAHTLGFAETDDPPDEAADALIEECVRLADAIGLPTSFEAVGLGPEDVDRMVENTLVQERRLKTNPRSVTDDVGATIRRDFQ